MTRSGSAQFISTTGGQFMSGFDFERDYPKYDVQWSPASRSVEAAG